MQDSIEDVSLRGDAYFEDGLRKVHYILAVTRISAFENYKIINTYIRNLQAAGLQFEQCYGITEPVVFIKIHLPEETMLFVQEKFYAWNELIKDKPGKYKRQFKFVRWFTTDLHYRQVIETDSICGKIYYINEILKSTKFTERESDRGIHKLLDKKIITKAYPLHDGRIQFNLWDNDSLLNDRTLLAKYWARFLFFFKVQPLDMIKKYYGLEIAFYFAWLGFYLRMLIPIVIVSLLMFTYTIYRYYKQYIILMDSCNHADVQLCGYCVKSLSKCYTINLHSMCGSYGITIMFEYQSFIYSILMTIWAGMVYILWKRYQRKLKKKWNIMEMENQVEVRLLYLKKQRNRRKSLTTGKIEIYTPTLEKIYKIIATYFVIFLIFAFLVLLLFLNLTLTDMIKIEILYKMDFENRKNIEMICDAFTITVQFLIVRIAWTGLTRTCIRLMLFQRHKYQQDHDKGFLFLRYICAFINQYLIFFYFAFIKGNTYNIPYDTISGYIQYEKCHMSSCMDILLIVLNIVAVLFFLGKVVELVKIKKKPATRYSFLPQFEEEYKLNTISMYHFSVEYIQNMILHGFLVFFATGNFAGSLFTLFNFLARLRIDAYNFIYSNQRPIPKIIYNVDAWNDVLLFLTIVSVTINAMVSMFTSDAVNIYRYLLDNANLSEYYKEHFTLFNQKDIFGSNPKYNQTCYFRSYSYPHDHPMKYKNSLDHWRLFAFKSIGLIMFEFIGIIVIVIANIIVNLLFKSKNEVLVDKTEYLNELIKKNSSIENLFKVSMDD